MHFHSEMSRGGRGASEHPPTPSLQMKPWSVNIESKVCQHLLAQSYYQKRISLEQYKLTQVCDMSTWIHIPHTLITYLQYVPTHHGPCHNELSLYTSWLWPSHYPQVGWHRCALSRELRKCVLHSVTHIVSRHQCMHTPIYGVKLIKGTSRN